ncbi:MAG TPA: hypothetical protein VFX39_05640 [Gemmatimonadaceae bacterium]|nr:hypothetical protein [Gemmatimonadaceae bacterium]
MLAAADEFFPTIGLSATASGERSRGFAGALGTLTLLVKAEGGHYTFIEADTDQMGESRLDRNVKKFFVGLHRLANPGHRLHAAF